MYASTSVANIVTFPGTPASYSITDPIPTNVTVGTNKITLTFKNCKDEIVYSNVGSAMGWSVQDDFNKSTKRVFDKIKSSNYVFDPSMTPIPILGQVDKTDET